MAYTTDAVFSVERRERERIEPPLKMRTCSIKKEYQRLMAKVFPNCVKTANNNPNGKKYSHQKL